MLSRFIEDMPNPSGGAHTVGRNFRRNTGY